MADVATGFSSPNYGNRPETAQKKNSRPENCMTDKAWSNGVEQRKGSEKQNQRKKEETVAEKGSEYFIYKSSSDARFVKIR